MNKGKEDELQYKVKTFDRVLSPFMQDIREKLPELIKIKFSRAKA